MFLMGMHTNVHSKSQDLHLSMYLFSLKMYHQMFHFSKKMKPVALYFHIHVFSVCFEDLGAMPY